MEERRFVIKTSTGFTLVEMAVVVFLIGILATAGLTALNARLANENINVTKQKEATIKDALVTYLGAHKRLPCPAISENGLESRNTANPTACTGYFGLLPYQELGLPKSAALDGWDDFFSYAVSPQWTLTYDTITAGTSTTNSAISFNTGDNGTIVVSERIPASNPTPTLTNNIVALLVSHGKNGLGGYTNKGTQNTSPPGADEIANTIQTMGTLPVTFYQREYTEIDEPTYGSYDDVLLRLNANDLITPLVKDGAIKSAQAQWAEQTERISDAIVGYMMSSDNSTCSTPNAIYLQTLLTNNNIPLTDPWGDSIAANYLRGFCNIIKSSDIHYGASCTLLSTGTLASYIINSPNGGTVTGKTNIELYGSSSFNAVITTKCPLI